MSFYVHLGCLAFTPTKATIGSLPIPLYHKSSHAHAHTYAHTHLYELPSQTTRVTSGSQPQLVLCFWEGRAPLTQLDVGLTIVLGRRDMLYLDWTSCTRLEMKKKNQKKKYRNCHIKKQKMCQPKVTTRGYDASKRASQKFRFVPL